MHTGSKSRTMTPAEIAIRKALVTTVPGKWRAAPWGNGSTPSGYLNIFCDEAEVTIAENVIEADANSIVTIKNNISAILAELDKTREEV